MAVRIHVPDISAMAYSSVQQVIRWEFATVNELMKQNSVLSMVPMKE